MSKGIDRKIKKIAERRKEVNIMKRIDELKKEIEDIIQNLNDTQTDFLHNYGDLSNYCYLSDIITEFADGNVNIYYSDIENYYKEHIKESSDALKEFGYNLSDFEDLEEATHTGSQLAQFLEIEYELYEDDRLEELQNLQIELSDIISGEA